MRSILRIFLVSALVAIMAVGPATACHPVYYGYQYGYGCCGDVCGPPCCSDCSMPCGPCGDGGEVMHAAPQGRMDMRAPTEAPLKPRQEMPVRPKSGGETLVPPAVPPTHEPESPTTRAPAESAPPVMPVLPEEPSRMPAETPAEPEAVPGGLFGPSSEEEPGGIGDLFGPSEDSGMATPAEEPAMPSEQPAESMTEEPSEETTPDSLFGGPMEEESTEPAEEATPGDLFGEPAEEDYTQPVEEAPPAEEEQDEDVNLDDLFGQADSILREPGGLASDDLRLWVDDTGRYTCRGRLIKMLDGQVRLLKDNGRTTTVQLSRLSEADLEFVNRQASAQMAGAIAGTTPDAPTWLAN